MEFIWWYLLNKGAIHDWIWMVDIGHSSMWPPLKVPGTKKLTTVEASYLVNMFFVGHSSMKDRSVRIKIFQLENICWFAWPLLTKCEIFLQWRIHWQCDPSFIDGSPIEYINTKYEASTVVSFLVPGTFRGGHMDLWPVATIQIQSQIGP